VEQASWPVLPSQKFAETDSIKFGADFNGRGEIVMQDAAAYQKILDDLDELESIAGIMRGLADVEHGRVTPLTKFETEFRKKHAIPRRSR